MSAFELAGRVIALAHARGLRIATAESCTGGMIAAAITDVAGASDVFEGGAVTYSNAMKARLLNVPETLLSAHGAVSAQVAAAMAEGAVRAFSVDLAVSVTGVAGPGGGTAEKPVGLVWFGLAAHGGHAHTERRLFPPDSTRARIRELTVETALALMDAALSAQTPGAPDSAP